MAEAAALVDAALRAAGVPILGVSIGTPTNRATWSVQFDPSATAAHKAQAASVLASVVVDPADPVVIAAQLDRDAQSAASQVVAKALLAVQLEGRLGRPLTLGDLAALQALWTRARVYYTFIVTNGL